MKAIDQIEPLQLGDLFDAHQIVETRARELIREAAAARREGRVADARWAERAAEREMTYVMTLETRIRSLL